MSKKSLLNQRIIPKETLIQIYRWMLKSRVLEERLIAMPKHHHGFFWIGGPGEEAFNVPLGLFIKKGQGLDFDYLHLHYRSLATLLVMGMDPKDAIRQMKNTALDRHTGGRNFCSHYSMPEWNIPPITSPVGTQFITAIGTGIAQRHHQGITIVNGGDATTAQGDFASCLVWASRPQQELPILIIITNNQWGISTAAHTQHGEHHIAERGTAFGIKNKVINGNNVLESYTALQEAMHYVRTERRPFLLEARVSRLYGHSSASGAMLHTEELDPTALFEKQLQEAGLISEADVTQWRKEDEAEFLKIAEEVVREPQPSADSIYDFTYFEQQGKYW